jgi:hypothetical protein
MSSARDASSSFSCMRVRRDSTVSLETYNCWAIAALVYPSAISRDEPRRQTAVRAAAARCLNARDLRE